MTDRVQQWLLQADYDLGTADAMFDTGRYIYAVFMAHLAIEKTLKARYQQVHNEVPPKVHNLAYLAQKNMDVYPPELAKALLKLNEANIATRYPEDLAKIQRLYPRDIVAGLIKDAKEINLWTRSKCMESLNDSDKP